MACVPAQGLATALMVLWGALPFNDDDDGQACAVGFSHVAVGLVVVAGPLSAYAGYPAGVVALLVLRVAVPGTRRAAAANSQMHSSTAAADTHMHSPIRCRRRRCSRGNAPARDTPLWGARAVWRCTAPAL